MGSCVVDCLVRGRVRVWGKVRVGEGSRIGGRIGGGVKVRVKITVKAKVKAKIKA